MSPAARRGATAQVDAAPVDRHQQVLDAATHVFSERGYRATSMWDLARAVGLSKPALYHYVSSKEALLVELYEGATIGGIDSAQQMLARSDLSPLDAIRELLIERIKFTCDNQRLLQICFEEEAEIPADLRLRMRRRRRRYDDVLIQLLERGVEDGVFELDTSPRIAVATLLGAALWTYKWFDPEGPMTSLDVAEDMTQLLLTGLLKRS